MNSGIASIVKLCVAEMDFCTSIVIGRSRMMKNEKPEMPIANATGMPSSRKTKKITIAMPMPYSPHLSTGFLMVSTSLTEVEIIISSAPTGTEAVTVAYVTFNVVIMRL